MENKLLGVNQVCEQLGLSRSLVYGLLSEGRLRSLRVGRRRLVPASAVDEFILNQMDEEVNASNG